MASYIERRKFLATLGGAGAWPVVARAQQPAMPVVGFMNSGSSSGMAFFVTAFRNGLKERPQRRGRISLGRGPTRIGRFSTGTTNDRPTRRAARNRDLTSLSADTARFR
jgi:hypothetical protein